MRFPDYHHSRLSLKVSGNSADGTGGVSGAGPLSSTSAVDESDEQMSPTDTASLLPPPPSAIDSLVETTVMPVVDNRSLKQVGVLIIYIIGFFLNKNNVFYQFLLSIYLSFSIRFQYWMIGGLLGNWSNLSPLFRKIFNYKK